MSPIHMGHDKAVGCVATLLAWASWLKYVLSTIELLSWEAQK